MTLEELEKKAEQIFPQEEEQQENPHSNHILLKEYTQLFNGNDTPALFHTLWGYGQKDLDLYVEEYTPRQARKVMAFMTRRAFINDTLQKLKMSREEAKHRSNPYRIRFLVSLLLMLLVCFGAPFLLGWMKDAYTNGVRIYNVTVGSAITLLAINLVTVTVPMIRFDLLKWCMKGEDKINNTINKHSKQLEELEKKNKVFEENQNE